MGDLVKDSQLSAHLQAAATALTHVRGGFSDFIHHALGIKDRIKMWRLGFLIIKKKAKNFGLRKRAPGIGDPTELAAKHPALICAAWHANPSISTLGMILLSPTRL